MLQAASRAEEAKKAFDIKYNIPKEGAVMFFDNMAIPTDAAHAKNAHLFINYMLRPEVAAQNSNFISYANSNAASWPLVNADVKNNPGIFPTPGGDAEAVPDLPESPEFTRDADAHLDALPHRQVSPGGRRLGSGGRPGFQALQRGSPMQTAERRADKNKIKAEPWRDPHAEAYVRIENITKKFGDFVAVNNVSLKIYQGEIFCLLGGSGCGKSTLLRMLAGFEAPTSGTHLPRRPGHGRHAAVRAAGQHDVPVVRAVPAHDGGEERRLRPGAGEACRSAEIATRVDRHPRHRASWAQFAKRKPHQLSGGQRQRVALARSLVKRPKLLLLDEPLGALDKKLREHTQFELINIQEQLGVTFIVVTHDQEEAMTLASRIGVMNRGEIVQIGTPTEIYEFPTTKFVADFIGSVNMFEGQLIEDLPDHVRIESDELGGVDLRRPRHQRGAQRHRVGGGAARRRSTSCARRRPMPRRTASRAW